MANALFPLGRRKFLLGQIDWEGDTFKVVALGATINEVTRETMEFASELSGALGTATTLTGTTALADGVADADDVSYPDVGIGDTVLALVIFKDTGVAATSPLIYYADENDDTTAISRSGDGANISILWSSTADRVFRL